ncbi:putative disease resistance RPP13-like protein 1 [Cornus florida]|uniref:putative disease resistance RPP13-like protein 1 n=1 Tax=Cornus florida TaxID=4283 RepID=UPI0028A178DE|nr:putative disease resistance RPP13-like protein 1 [Cornus florida]
MDVAGIFLGPIIQALLDKLVSPAVSNYARREGMDAQLKKLEKMLPAIRAVLANAEDKQLENNAAVKLWMDELTDLAYDLDDLLDDLATQTLGRELIKRQSHASTSTTSKVRQLNPLKLYHNMKSKKDMKSKIEDITKRLEDIEKQKSILKLKENAEVIGSKTTRGGRETTSFVYKSEVCGREQDQEAIVAELLKDEVSADNFSVIPIVGMGGIGKTTLAQLVYHDERVEGRFDLKAWVCVSDDFHAYVHRVTKAILEAILGEVTLKIDDSKSLDILQQKLKEKLTGKKFLLVLDDVWSDKYEDWQLLKLPFKVGAPGSKIIVTTRNEEVASTMTLSQLAYQLKGLSNDECLSLFAHHALEKENFDADPSLKGIGMEIVSKCKGLPLAVKTIAGLFRKKRQSSEWVDILNSKIWNLPEQSGGILPALQLSYHHLPSHLKQCFAYCATFPKDYEFDKAELVLLWMGIGLLQQSKEKDRMENFGNKCFDDLLSRSFFQQSGSSKSLFVMHDLLHDLAIHVAGNISVQLDKLEGNEQFEIPKRARHLSFVRQYFEVFQKFRPLCKVQHLRTLLALPVQAHEAAFLAKKVLFDLLPNLQCLRVLSLSGYFITELPNSIGHMKHLRYLNLSRTLIQSLPESISTLYNLQTLLLRGCENLCMFPPNTENLINLRHIDIVYTVKLRETSSGIGRLENLQTLPKFVVGSKNNGARLNELGNLSLLRGSISIEELQNIKDVRDANEANLRNKECLNEVELAWCSEFNDSRDEDLELDVLDTLQPHVNLKRLKVEFFGGREFPSWIGNPSFSEMVNLSLIGCRKCRSLPPLQQLPKLRELYIEGMHEVQNLGDGLPFPSLERLKFEDMPAWKEWCFSISIGVEESRSQFPCLRELSLRGCPNLITVSPLRLPSLQKLYLEECEEEVLKSIVGVTSLTSLEVVDIRGLSQLEEALVQSLVALESLVFKNCNQLMALWQNGSGVAQKNNLVRLQRLRVESCPQLVSFGEELDDEGLPCINLQELYVRDCVNLEKLPNELDKLTSLTSLEINGCSKLVCFPKAGVPHMLRRLEIRDCNALKSLPEGISGLKDLLVDDCVNLEDFNINNNIMSSLETLRIEKWPKVGMLVGGCVNNNNFASVRVLHVENCDGVESLSFPERGLPNLTSLQVWNCVNLRSLPSTNQILQNLESLWIIGCPSLEAFPERGCCLSTPNLRRLLIWGCNNLRWLPIDQIQSLASLESIRIWDCGKLKPLSEWSMHRLTSLQQFDIGGGYPELVSFPPDHDNDDYCLFPTTLTHLCILDMPNLKSVSLKGLQNLTFLTIGNCPNLKSISSSSSKGKGKGKGGGLQNFTSFQRLHIWNCPKLRSLPKEGLPATFQHLGIWNCPLLEKQCLGDYWPKIAHIPRVDINDDFLRLGC